MSRYSAFGLDEVKKEKDSGNRGLGYCFWGNLPPDSNGFTGHEVTRGFSLCFVNFVICKDCVNNSLLLYNADRWGLNECFKCKRKEVNCYHHTSYELAKGSIAICEDCIQWASNILNNSDHENTI